MSESQDEALGHEFDAIMARSGIVVPADWRTGAIVCYRDLKRMASLLRQPGIIASEPSNVYRLSASSPIRKS
jgi:hypothetical protein